MEICPLYIKRLFSYHEMDTIFNEYRIFRLTIQAPGRENNNAQRKIPQTTVRGSDVSKLSRYGTAKIPPPSMAKNAKQSPLVSLFTHFFLNDKMYLFMFILRL